MSLSLFSEERETHLPPELFARKEIPGFHQITMNTEGVVVGVYAKESVINNGQCSTGLMLSMENGRKRIRNSEFPFTSKYRNNTSRSLHLASESNERQHTHTHAISSQPEGSSDFVEDRLPTVSIEEFIHTVHILQQI